MKFIGQNTLHATRPNLVLSLIALFFIYIVLVGSLFLTRMEYGWDTTVYCDAVDAINAGKNPYITSNLEHSYLSFSYQPMFLEVFELPCAYRAVYVQYYPLLYLMLAIALPFFWCTHRNGHEMFIASALVFAGFAGFHWNILTGNVAIYELIILTFVFGLLRTNKVTASSFVLGAFSAWKLFPIVFLLPFAFYPGTLKKRLSLLLTGLAGFISLYLLSALLYPDLLSYFWTSITGGIPGQHSTMNEFHGEMINPSLLDFIKSLLNRLLVEQGWLLVILIYLTVALCIVIPTYIITKRIIFTGKDSTSNFIVIFSIWMLVLLLIMPRLKHYTFILATLPLFILIYRSNIISIRTKSFILLIACIPSIVHMPLLALYVSLTDHFLLGYSQLICLFITVVCILVLFWKQTSDNSSILAHTRYLQH